MNKFKPYFDKIHVEPFKEDAILIPEEGQTKKEMGEVIAIGDYVNFVKVGDILVFSSWGCDKFENDGKSYYVVAEDSRFILGKFNKNGVSK